MKSYRFKGLLQNQGWLENATVSLNEAGNITSISPEENPESIEIDGYALPGFQNAHSHAFQYAMAGLAENRASGAGADDFWSWRETMYRLALDLGPPQLKAIATMLYRELIRHGYTSVAEFHYLHHDVSGAPFANRAEMGQILIEAASD